MSVHVLIAPYPFKGTMTSHEAAVELARIVREARPDAECSLLPLGDGGSGTLDALVMGAGGEYRRARVTNALGRPVELRWGVIGEETAVIEAAQAIALVDIPPAERDPSRLTTRGLGELIRVVLDEGVRSIWVGLGDTATHDCGLGVASALGYKFVDDEGNELPPVGASLVRLAQIQTPVGGDALSGCSITALCDVLNPLLGPDGAALCFSAQKGADARMRDELEQGARRFAEAIERRFGLNVARIPGAGAGGGLGAGLAAFCGATLVGGADRVLDTVGFDARAAEHDLVITGEGRVDGQTLLGKGPSRVIERARRAGAGGLLVGGWIEGEVATISARLDAEVVELSRMAEAAALRPGIIR